MQASVGTRNSGCLWVPSSGVLCSSGAFMSGCTSSSCRRQRARSAGGWGAASKIGGGLMRESLSVWVDELCV